MLTVISKTEFRAQHVENLLWAPAWDVSIASQNQVVFEIAVELELSVSILMSCFLK